jgi:hypothetical protein
MSVQKPKAETDVDRVLRQTKDLFMAIAHIGRNALLNKNVFQDLALAMVNLAIYAGNPEGLHRSFARAAIHSALKRLDKEQVFYYEMALTRLDGSLVQTVVSVPVGVDHKAYLASCYLWDNQLSSHHILRQLAPEEAESYKKRKPLTDSERWVADQCVKSGLVAALAQVTKHIENYNRMPPKDLEAFAVSMVRTAQRYGVTSIQSDWVQQVAQQPRAITIEIWNASGVGFMIIQDQPRFLFPIKDLKTPTQFGQVMIKILPTASSAGFSILRTELNQEKQT